MAATGTPTPNIGLRRPQGTDPASVDEINYNSNLIDTKLGPVGNTSVQAQIDGLNSKLETGNDFDFTLNSSQTSRLEISKMRAKKFGGIYILCLVINPLDAIDTGEFQLGEVSVAPGLNTSTVVTRNSDTKPVGGANLLENRKLYLRLTESVNQGNLIYISLATTYN